MSHDHIEPFRYLASGVDTVEICYYLRAEGKSGLDFTALIAARDALRMKKGKATKVIRLGCEEFLLSNHGTNSGYSLFMENKSFQIAFGENNQPNFLIKYLSQALWHDGIDNLHERFLTWAASVGMRPYKTETISRVDYAYDYLIPQVDFDEDSFYSVAVGDARKRNRRITETMYFGSGDVLLRDYNKSLEIAKASGKVWFYPIWGGVVDDVWRIEWQFRTERLKQVGIRTLADLRERQGDLLRNHATAHTSLRVKQAGQDIKDCPLHPLWQDYLNRIEQMPAIGIVREFDANRVSEERMLRLLISVLGYMKRIAALQCVKQNAGHMPLGSALFFLRQRLLELYDPLDWEDGVAQRIREMGFQND
ncbi:MAG: hypothetical protein EOM37_08810 [Proteobacteria bacterium]|jgi:hypothetical protein|nr:hypothetical protein [Alphaproteobacteria bacterium]NCC04125.1 hypothetical protein [Pseudomonadota bacterium]